MPYPTWPTLDMEQSTGIEPVSPAWKADVLTANTMTANKKSDGISVALNSNRFVEVPLTLHPHRLHLHQRFPDPCSRNNR